MEEDIRFVSGAEIAAKKEKRKRLLKLLPMFLVLAAIMVYCIVVLFSDKKEKQKKQEKQKETREVLMTYTVNAINKYGDAVKTEINSYSAPFVLSENAWEDRCSFLAEVTDEGRVAGNCLQITVSSIPNAQVQIEIAKKGRESTLTVTDNGKLAMETAVATVWGGEDKEDSVWFCDLNNDGYPELLAGNDRLTEGDTFCVYDFRNHEAHKLVCGKDQYEIHCEFDSIAVWLREAKQDNTDGSWPYKDPIRGKFIMHNGQLLFEEQNFPYTDIPSEDGDRAVAVKWFDLDGGDENVGRAIRLPEYPELTFVAEESYAYCRSSDGAVFYWSDFSQVTGAYFYDIDGDGKREVFFAEHGVTAGARYLWVWDEPAANHAPDGLRYGQFTMQGGNLTAICNGYPMTEQTAYFLRPIYVNETVKLVRELGPNETFFWDNTSFVSISSMPGKYFDLNHGLIYSGTETTRLFDENYYREGEEYSGLYPGRMIIVPEVYGPVFDVARVFFVDLDGDGVQEFCADMAIGWAYGGRQQVVGDLISNQLVCYLDQGQEFRWLDNELWVVSDDYSEKFDRGTRIGRPVLRNGMVETK